MAIGSRRTWANWPEVAAVVSLPMVAPRKTPCDQLNASNTRGTVVGRRPPKMIASIGTPCGNWASAAADGLLIIGAVKREFGCAAFSFDSGVHLLPRQSRHSAGGGSSWPSHQTVPSGLSATFVKSVSREQGSIAFGFDLRFVPGATPQYPASGLIA